MKFKATKIRNIDKSVCVREQVVAHNLLFNMHGLSKCLSAEKFCDRIRERIAEITKEHKQLNSDLIYHIVLYNYRDYYNNGCKVMFDYKQLGQNFKIAYEII